MTVQTTTLDIAAIGVVKAVAPTLAPGARQAVNPATLTCRWVKTGDGALVMQWTGQTPEDTHEEMTKAAA